jgi:ketosteroid isomerase-like protein
MNEVASAQVEINRNTIRRAFEAWSNGTGAITDVLAPELVWRIEGNSAASRRYESKQQFVDEVLAPFGARFHSSSDPFRPIDIRGVYADGDTVIVLWNGRGTANDGRTYENSYAWFLTMRDGKVVDGTAFYDSIAFNDLWHRVAPGS